MTHGLLCLVTDRRRLAERLQIPSDDSVAALIDQIAAAAEAGVDLVVVREPDLPARTLATLVRETLAVVRGRARVVVNDRLDVALACGADGVHLRGRSFDVAAARQIAPRPFLIGRSVHDEAAAREAADADYLFAGTVFATASKPGATRLLGTEGVRRIAAASSAPVLGIGGVDRPELVAAVMGAGAAGVAAIGGLQPTGVGGGAVTTVQNCVRRLRSGFDLSGRLS